MILKTDGFGNVYTTYSFIEELKARENLSEIFYNRLDIDEINYTDKKTLLNDFIKSNKKKEINTQYNYNTIKVLYSTKYEQTYLFALYSSEGDSSNIFGLTILHPHPTLKEVETKCKEILNNLTSIDNNKKEKNKISIITEGRNLELSTVNIDNVPEFNINSYNSDFKSFYETLKTGLDSTGLTLMYGKPGTGKSTFIKMLSKLYYKKDFIFVPPGMSEVLSSPGIIKFLLSECKNSVLVIEDAEDSLITRNESRNSKVSTILNMTDGIMSDVLNIHIICTFNVNLSDIDPALKRPGRLKASYEFKALEKDVIKRITNNRINESMTIAELFNKRTDTIENNKIGF